MSTRSARITGTAFLAAIVLLLPLAGRLKQAHAAGVAGQQAKTDAATTTQKDQTDLSVTVYNSNLALVRDVRKIRLQSGVSPLRF